MGIVIRVHVRVSGEMQHQIESHVDVKTANFGDVIEIELQDNVTLGQAKTLIAELRDSLIEVKKLS